MELTELEALIRKTFRGSTEELEMLLLQAQKNKGVYPFNEYEYLLSTMLEEGNITHEEYTSIRNSYILRNSNLSLFEESAPRKFGEEHAEPLLQRICSKLQKPSKVLDPDYSGQYDLWLDNIKIEVKASRVTDRKSQEPLYKKALSSNSTKDFLMNFQQLKPQCCDVFVWIAFYRDTETMWVMSSHEVKKHKGYSVGQHRGNKGNEGQLHVTRSNIKSLDKYILKNANAQELEDAIRKAALRNEKDKGYDQLLF